MTFKEFLEESKFELTVAGILFLLFVLYVTIQPAERYKCHSFEEVTEMETKFVFLDGCYVHTKDGWRARDQFRVTD